jgi:hypothetical protein
MTGRKSLAEIRSELEAVMDQIPADGGAVTKALHEFLANGPVAASQMPPKDHATASTPVNKTSKRGAGVDRRKSRSK